jgi:hypothetical protein
MHFPALTKLPTTVVSRLRATDRSATNSFATLLILFFIGFAPPTVAATILPERSGHVDSGL